MRNKINGLINNAIARENKYLEERKRDWNETRKFMRQIDESLLPEGTQVFGGSGSITIRVKWGVDNLRAARLAMGDGWNFSNNWTDTSGTLTKSYYRYGEPIAPADPYSARQYVNLNLIMDATELDEQTCKRIEIGEKTFIQKVYQVICEDGVKEVLGRAEEMDKEVE